MRDLQPVSAEKYKHIVTMEASNTILLQKMPQSIKMLFSFFCKLLYNPIWHVSHSPLTT